jgi:hypothetical protein
VLELIGPIWVSDHDVDSGEAEVQKRRSWSTTCAAVPATNVGARLRVRVDTYDVVIDASDCGRVASGGLGACIDPLAHAEDLLGRCEAVGWYPAVRELTGDPYPAGVGSRRAHLERGDIRHDDQLMTYPPASDEFLAEIFER